MVDDSMIRTHMEDGESGGIYRKPAMPLSGADFDGDMASVPEEALWHIAKNNPNKAFVMIIGDLEDYDMWFDYIYEKSIPEDSNSNILVHDLRDEDDLWMFDANIKTSGGVKNVGIIDVKTLRNRHSIVSPSEDLFGIIYIYCGRFTI